MVTEQNVTVLFLQVAKFFPKLSKRFRPEEVLVVTWEGVGYFDRKNDKVTK